MSDGTLTFGRRAVGVGCLASESSLVLASACQSLVACCYHLAL